MKNVIKSKGIFVILCLVFSWTSSNADYVFLEPKINKTVEVVFVIDDSASIEMFQRNLANNIVSLLEPFAVNSTAVKVGILTTSSKDQNQMEILN